MNRIIVLLIAMLTSFLTFAKDDVLTFTAKIENRNSDTLTIRGANRFSKQIIADKKGDFKSTFEVEEGFYQMFDGTEYAQLYLKNGYVLFVSLDAKAFDETIKFTGKGAAENNYLADRTIKDAGYDYDTLLNADEKEFQNLLDARKNDVLATLKGKNLANGFVEKYSKDIEQSLNGLKAYYEHVLESKKMNGTMSPDFAFENYNGGTTSLTDLKGKYVYIDVWATWCGPCRAEIPFLKKAEHKYEGKNISFVSLSIDRVTDKEKWAKFIVDKELGGIQLFAEADWKSQFVEDYKIKGIPRFILLDPAGKIVNADAPRPSSPELTVLFDTLLK